MDAGATSFLGIGQIGGLPALSICRRYCYRRTGNTLFSSAHLLQVNQWARYAARS